jgi:hypothetical protein
MIEVKEVAAQVMLSQRTVHAPQSLEGLSPDETRESMAHGKTEAELSNAHPLLLVMSAKKPQPRSHWIPGAGLLVKLRPHWLPCLLQQPQPTVRTVIGQESLLAHTEHNL